MTETPCPRCRKATTDGLLCHPCTALYARARKDLARYTPELRTAWLQLDQVARGIVHRDDHTLELAAAEAAEAARVPAMLRTKHAEIALPATAMPVNLQAGRLYRRAVLWLASTPTDPDVLRRRLDAADLVDQARRLADTVERAIDTRDPELYLGVCDVPDTVHVDTDLAADGTVTFTLDTTDRICGVNLWARPGDTTVTCDGCGYEYAVADRRAERLAEVRNLLERPKVIAEALTSMDLPVTANTLDQWITRDRRLHEQGRGRRDGLPLILADPVYDDDGRPLYALGPVIDRVEALRAKSDQAG